MQGAAMLRRISGRRAAVGAVLLLCVLLQVLMALLVSEQGVLRIVKLRTALQLEILKGAEDQEISQLYAALRQHASVEEVHYTTREQVYEEERKRDPDFIAFLEKFQLENPFPNTLSVVVRSVDDYRVLGEFLQSEPWRKIVDPQFLRRSADQEAEVRSILGVLSAARVGLLLMVIVAALALVLGAGRAMRLSSAAANVPVLLGAGAWRMTLPAAVAIGMLLVLGMLLGAAVIGGSAVALQMLAPAGTSAIAAFLRAELLPMLLLASPGLLLAELLAIVPLSLLAARVAVRPDVCAPSLLPMPLGFGKLRRA